jgi:acetyltransferase-like isoleucine patch superfamily enzyme
MASPGERGARAHLKRLVHLAALTLVSPLYVLYRLNSLLLSPEASIQGLSQLLSLVPGQPGNLLRAGFYHLTLQRCSLDCTISFGTIFSTPFCEIGSHVYIGAYCVISDCSIGNDSLLGSHVHVISGKHAHGFEASATPMRLQPASRSVVRIGADSWIGNGAVLMADVGTGCVIGAGSVVTRPVEAQAIAAGNPARTIRTRAPQPAP